MFVFDINFKTICIDIEPSLLKFFLKIFKFGTFDPETLLKARVVILFRFISHRYVPKSFFSKVRNRNLRSQNVVRFHFSRIIEILDNKTGPMPGNSADLAFSYYPIGIISHNIRSAYSSSVLRSTWHRDTNRTPSPKPVLRY